MKLILSSILIITTISLSAQISCDSGSELECMCETAEILCSVVELDGFTGGMSPFQHPQDGPDGFCPPTNAVSDNPTWFAFIAWCDEIDMTVTLSNCLPGGSNNQFLGAQLAVFPACNTNNAIDCASDCNVTTPHEIELTLDNLTIGQVYYFMIDGCGGAGNGSTCDYEIGVSPTNCNEEIEEWTNDIAGETSFCIGESETYVVDDLDGATSYHWEIDGTEVSETSDETETFIWDTEGEFMLCVDVSNECVDISEDPMPICTTIVVSEPDAGSLVATPNPLCPGEISSVTVSGHKDDALSETHLIVVDPSGLVLDVVQVDPTTIDVTFDQCGNVKVYSLNFASAEAVPIPAIDDSYSGSDCVTFCCDEICEIIIFEDTTDPDFPSAPGDETLACFDLVPLLEDQLATDNCAADELIAGTETGSANLCDGGTLTREWTQTDDCGNTTTHTQVITIEPISPPDFLSPPGDQTLSCDDPIPPAIDLMYSNNESGGCLIEGLETPTVLGAFDLCGSTIEYTWEFTDMCGNTITHTQFITIEPADPPTFSNPPSDLTLTCDDDIPIADVLNYSNGQTGTCLIEGSVTPLVVGAFDPCGSTITYSWNFTDPCGINLMHTQTITIDPAQVPNFVNPPGDVTLACDEVVPSPIDLSFTNNQPGICLIDGAESPEVTGAADVCGSTIEYLWEYTDNCNNLIQHTQTITIDPAPEAIFTNLPSDLTLTCEEYDSFTFADLNYSNSESGSCLIEGVVSPVITDNSNSCSGTIEAFYEFQDDCSRIISHTQTITLEAPLEAAFLNPPANLTVSCDEVPSGSPPPLDYTNGSIGSCLIIGSENASTNNNVDACGGNILHLWEFTDDCGRTISYQQIITVDPAAEAVFTSLPQDIQLTCQEFDSFSPEILQYTNSESGICLISGTETPTSTGNITTCGGSITYDWQFTDNCGRTITHSQTVTVLPAQEAVFVDVPEDMTLDCSQTTTILPTLSYENGESGICDISGDVTAIETGFVDECGGTITYNWTFTDDCSRTITEEQIITYTPASEPEWINPPADLTVDCNEDVPDPIILEYDNNENSPCDINGTTTATITNIDNVYEYTWEFTNSCTGQLLTHTQILTKLVPIELEIDEFEFTFCLGEEFDLSTINPIDLNGSTFTLSYHDNNPPTTSNEIDPEIILEEEEEEFYILVENEFGCTSIIEVILFATIEVNAGGDFSDDFCIDNGILDLFSFLDHTVDLFGEWTLLDGPSNLDLIDASEVNVSGADAGIYLFEYFVDSGSTCPGDVAEIEIELFAAIDIDLISIACDANGDTYTVVTTNDEYDIDTNAGTVTETPTTITISGIPITTNLEINAQDDNSRCENDFNFNAPDCSCPSVASPVAGPDSRVCQGDPNPQLNMSQVPDAIINWYDEPIAGTLLLGNSLAYTPTEQLPGIYTFYAEAESTLQAGCVSATRTPITLEIIARPAVQDTFINLCMAPSGTLLTLDQSTAENTISGNVTNLVTTFYPSEVDRQQGTNIIVFPLTIQSPSPTILFARSANAANCFTDVSLTIHTNPLPQLTGAVTDESCLGNEDGIIALSATNNGIPYDIIFRNDTLINETLTDLRPGNYSFTIVDSLTCTNSYETEVASGNELNIEDLLSTCDNNGTSTDPSDDFYNITFSVSNILGTAGEYNLTLLPDNTTELQSYNSTVTINRPADGTIVTLVATDVISNCSVEVDLPPLLSCSSDCSINLLFLESDCSDNNTGLDPSDDLYNFTINATAENGSNSNTYSVLIDGVVTFSFDYGTDNTFSLPASDEIVSITISDSQFGGCELTTDTEVLAPCSNDCLIEATLISNICDNAGTPATVDDDLYTVSITVGGINISSGFTDTNTGLSYSYGEVLTFNNLLITDGAINFNFVDNADNTCIQNISVDPPLSCSEPCETAINTFVVGDCDDNGTANNNSDDVFSILINIGAIDGIVGGVILTDNTGIIYGPFSYDTDINIGPFAANGEEVTFTITDQNNGSCLLMQSFSQDACSEACLLSASQVEVTCNNEGTLDIVEDDTYSITVTIDGLNSATTFTEQNSGVSGVYGEPFTLSDFLIIDGGVSLNFIDAVENTCSIELNVEAPMSCSEPCETLINNIEIGQCDDNGTPNNSDDDFYNVTLNVSLIDGIGGDLSITDNFGISYGPFSYDTDITIGPFDSDGSLTTITITDLTNGTCRLEESFSNQACSEACMISATLISTSCDDAGTTGTNDDDLYSVLLVVDGINMSTQGFTTNTGETGLYGDPIQIDNQLIANGELLLDIIDLEDSNCTATLTVQPPAPCSSPCTIDWASFDIVPCNDGGTPSDPSDDFFAVTFEVTTLVGVVNTYLVQDSKGETYGPFEYDMPVELGPFVTDGELITLTVVDTDNSNCTLEETISSDSCSDLCQLAATVISVICDDNGTTDTALDDIFSTSISITEINSSGSIEIFETGQVFQIPGTIVIDDLLILDGPLTYNIQDVSNSLCTATIDIIPPASCSDPCSVDLADFNLLDCTDNMTGDISDDDIFLIELTVTSGIGAGNEYSLMDDMGNSYGPFAYDELITAGPFMANSEDINLFLVDADNGSCSLSLPSFNSPPCSLCNKTIALEADNPMLSCQDGDAVISVISSENPETFDWSGPAGFTSDEPFITVATSGTYSLTVTFSDGCTSQDDLTLTSDNSIPMSNIGPDILLNCDLMSTTLTLDNSILTTNTTVEWVDESGTVISTDDFLDVDAQGTYGLILRDTLSGCESPLDEVTVTENFNSPLAIIFANPDSILNCFIETIALSHEEEPNTVYTWFVNGNEVFETNIIEPGNVQLVALDTISACTSEDFLTIDELTEFPIIELSDIPEINCGNTTVCISASSPTTNPVTYQWFDEDGNLVLDGNDELCIENPGSYSLFATDVSTDCVNDASFVVEEQDIPEVSLPGIITLTLNQTLTLDPQISVPESSLESISWTTPANLSCTDCLRPQVLGFESGDIVELTIITSDGCAVSAFTTLIIETIELPKIYIPNIFSPESTGNFTIYTNDQIVNILEVNIYDRWGNLVFVNTNFPPNQQSVGWDGRYKNIKAEQGVYVYFFAYELDGRREIESGDVTLIR